MLNIKTKIIVLGIVLKRRINNMIKLKCKKCNVPTTCDEEAVKVTCSECSMIDLILHCENQIMGVA